MRTVDAPNTKDSEMPKKMRIAEDAWDSRTLGADAAHVGVADESHEHDLDEALELQAISIRLPKKLLNDYKAIAQFHGVGYQPLMRDVLQRFVVSELEYLAKQRRAAAATGASGSLIPDRKTG